MEIASKLRCPAVLLLVFLGFNTIDSCSSEKVLLVPPPRGKSHWMALAKVGRALVEKGHLVTVVVSEDIVEKRRTEWPDFQFEAFQDQGIEARLKTLQDNVHSVARILSLYELRDIFVTAFGEFRNYCALLLAHFRVPHIALMRGDPNCLDEKATGVPLPPSYVPSLATDFTDDMSFAQRLQNVLLYTFLPMISRWGASSLYDELVRKYVGEEETIQSVTSRTDLWLYLTDNVLDFPRPIMPNMVQVGGLNVREADPLTEDTETFVQSSGEDGVIVVSFGSMVKTMSKDKREIFAAAFARLRQKVVWRYVGEKPAGLGNNTKLLGWLPQNDLLAHPKTRVFVTHAGLNGVYEALHHGVPMVCLPLFADEPANAARVVARGLGVTLDFSTVTADQLYQAILLVLTNNSYHETAARLSRLHRDQPQSPMERAVWWIEHVIQHGRLPHLRARAVELPWYQYYLLDVAALLLSVCSAVLVTLWCGCSLVCRKCCANGGGKLKSQ
ncbi:PREDICTED: UDP-glucuronosyltransferase 2C1-like [Branchiostoma belcheri]|uniref:UDP-glucuronosyltransferase n=1 Tax=Branchiostoma belcheri TaxID=7741 RepID=A0A6P4YKW0_BRABE|nr:PREDICTED: UDP-glucuronosyltransferase 2C1-like [Branchiostoma belcheri]